MNQTIKSTVYLWSHIKWKHLKVSSNRCDTLFSLQIFFFWKIVNHWLQIRVFIRFSNLEAHACSKWSNWINKYSILERLLSQTEDFLTKINFLYFTYLTKFCKSNLSGILHPKKYFLNANIERILIFSFFSYSYFSAI